MKKDKKQEMFHDYLLQMLYPPPPSLDDPPQEEEENNKLIDTLYNFPEDVENYENDESPSISAEDNEDENVGSVKLTRAKSRKKKLKETASQRRKIIGPLLPGSGGDEGDCGGGVLETITESVRRNAAAENVPECVRQNVAEGNVAETVRRNAAEGDTTGTDSTCSWLKQNKLKQRRKSKKLGGGNLSLSSMGTSESIEVEDRQREANDERVDP